MPKQINEKLQEVDGKDENYKPSELVEMTIQTLESLLSEFPWNNIQKIDNKVKISYLGEELYFSVKNFCWVGVKNPENKKRIVVSLNLEEEELLYQQKFFLIGVYRFSKVNVYALYEVERKKREREWNMSSVMWIKTEELKNTLINGYTKKHDRLGTIHLFKEFKNLFTYLFKLKERKRQRNEEFVKISTEPNNLVEEKETLISPQPIIPIYKENIFVNLTTKKFELEEEIQKIFEDNLSTIFPNLTFLRNQCEIPRHKWDKVDERIDSLAFHHQREDEWENFVLLEYKWESRKENPINQLQGYHGALMGDSGNFDALKDILEDYLGKSLDWKYNSKFWEKFILICVVPFGYYSSSYPIERQVEGLKQYKIRTVLIEIKKYENDTILISFVRNENRDEHMKLLGVEFHKIIIQRKVN